MTPLQDMQMTLSSSTKEEDTKSGIVGFVTSALSWIAILGMLLMLIGPIFLVPAEDATILFQYSDNWATTGQITYFAGGPRVEGATDFLWMAILTVFRLLHIEAFYATAVLNVLSAIAIAYLVLLLAGKRFTWKSMLIPLGLVMLAPQLGAALAGFSVLPFTALILACAYFFYRGRDSALAVTCLLLCLFRPDGVVFAFPMIAIRLFSEKAAFAKKVGIYLLLFAVPGLIYFYWRWKYFGEILPLPFLVKSDTPRFMGIALGTSNIDILKYLAFNIVFLWLVLGKRIRERTNLLLLTALGIFPTLFYLTMRLDQDIADRFFAYLLVCSAVLVAINWNSLRVSHARATSIFAVLWVLLLSLAWASGLSRFISDGYKNIIVSISKDLAKVHPNGTLALSEAGRVAYFSRWPTTDLWGLNTPEFAHHLFAPADIASVSPDLLVLYYPQAQHDCRFKPGWDTPYVKRVWPNLARNVITGIHDSGNYDLWMVPSSGVLRRALHGNKPGAGEYQCWFVKKTFAGHDQVVDILARHAAMPEADFVRIRFSSGSDQAH
jgi:hypothetical protein